MNKCPITPKIKIRGPVQLAGTEMRLLHYWSSPTGLSDLTSYLDVEPDMNGAVKSGLFYCEYWNVSLYCSVSYICYHQTQNNKSLIAVQGTWCTPQKKKKKKKIKFWFFQNLILIVSNFNFSWILPSSFQMKRDLTPEHLISVLPIYFSVSSVFFLPSSSSGWSSCSVGFTQERNGTSPDHSRGKMFQWWDTKLVIQRWDS